MKVRELIKILEESNQEAEINIVQGYAELTLQAEDDYYTEEIATFERTLNSDMFVVKE